jgi:hypothetical protein
MGLPGWPVFLVLMLGMLGCETSPPELGEAEPLKALRARWNEPVPIKVLFGVEETDGFVVQKTGEDDEYRVKPDSRSFFKAWDELVSGGPWFTQGTVSLDSRTGNEEELEKDGEVLTHITFENTSRDVLLREARERGSEYLVLVRLHDAKISYLGASGSFIWSLVVWSLFIPPTWWIPDEAYEGSFAATIRILDLRKSEPEEVKSFTYKADIKRNLHDFSRGWNLGDILPFPGLISTGSYVDAERHLQDWFHYDFCPQALVKCCDFFRERYDRERAEEAERKRLEAEEAARAAEPRPLPKPKPKPLPKPRPQPPRGFLLCAGVGAYPKGDEKGCRFCPGDAQAVFQAFAALPPYSKSRAHTRLLEDGSANRAGVEKSLSAIFDRRPSRQDEVTLYFSGCGALEKSGAAHRLVFVPHGETAKTAAQGRGISLEGLVDRLGRLPSGKKTLILDLGLSPQGLRSMVTQDGKAVAEALARLGKRAASHSNLVVLMADDGKGDALETASLSHGLFTGLLLENIKKGSSSAGELTRRLGDAVSSQAGFMARRQTPRCFGSKVIRIP